MQGDLGVWGGAPSAIRTRDLLLRRHSPDVDGCRLVWPDVAFSCTDSGWTWPGVAQYLSLLAPRLAPRDLVSFANADFHSANQPPVRSGVLVAEGAATPPGHVDRLGEAGLAQHG